MPRGMVCELEAGLPLQLLDGLEQKPPWLEGMPAGEPPLCLRLPAPIAEMVCASGLRRVWVPSLPAGRARAGSTIMIPWPKLKIFGVRPPAPPPVAAEQAGGEALTPELCDEVANVLRKASPLPHAVDGVARLHKLVAALQGYIDDSSPVALQHHLKTPYGADVRGRVSNRYAAEFMVRVLLLCRP